MEVTLAYDKVGEEYIVHVYPVSYGEHDIMYLHIPVQKCHAPTKKLAYETAHKFCTEYHLTIIKIGENSIIHPIPSLDIYHS